MPLVCKNPGNFSKFIGFFSRILREQARLRKSNTPRKWTEKWIFLSLAIYNAPSLRTVENRSEKRQNPSDRDMAQIGTCITIRHRP